MLLLDLPPELLTTCLRLLPARDLVAVCQACKDLRDISRIEIIWQIRSARDFQFTSLEGWNCTFYEIYTKVLYRFGRLKGLFRAKRVWYGGLITVNQLPGCIEGVELQPEGDIRRPLMKKSLFKITLDRNQQVQTTCCQGHSDPHPGEITFEGDEVVLRCCDTQNHRHPEGEEIEKELFSKECKIRGMYAADLCHCKYKVLRKNEKELKMVPLHIPPEEVPTVGVKPGLFKGMYGGHGTELIMLHYDVENKKAKALKITGDPNVPAGEISIEADLERPMMLSREQQVTLQMLRDIDTFDIGPELQLDKIPQQPFEVPIGVDIEDGCPIANLCKLRFHSQGTVSPHGYSHPSKIPNHWIVFNQNLFGVLWLDLYSFGFFSRVVDLEVTP